MRAISFLLSLMMVLQASAQQTETYYDYLWKPVEPVKARFYSVLKKTDSGWLRNDYFLSGMKLQMRALYEDSTCKIYNGQSVFLYANGNVSSIGTMVHGKQEGVCLSFHSNGMISDSALYHNGRPVGNNYSWYANGVMEDSVAHVNDSLDVLVSWFDNGSPSSAGYLLKNKLHGKWKFFHSTGGVAAEEVYRNGQLISAQYFNEDGTTQTDTSKVFRITAFKGGSKDWVKYMEKKLYWPPNLKFDNGDMAVVVINIVINESGKVELAEVVTPFHPEFDKIALRVVKDSPDWQPGMEHNRRVKTSFHQPVVFRQPEE